MKLKRKAKTKDFLVVSPRSPADDGGRPDKQQFALSDEKPPLFFQSANAVPELLYPLYQDLLLDRRHVLPEGSQGLLLLELCVLYINNSLLNLKKR